jgi:hypothetical protein
MRSGPGLSRQRRVQLRCLRVLKHRLQAEACYTLASRLNRYARITREGLTSAFDGYTIQARRNALCKPPRP